MGGGGGENNDELWTEIFNIPVIVLFLFSERKTCLQRLLICCYFQPYKLEGEGAWLRIRMSFGQKFPIFL